MKKKLILAICIAVCAMLLAITASATSVVPQKPTLDVDFGSVTTIDGFTAPSDKFTTTERVLLTDGEGNYVTYPTYYVTKDNTTFDFDFSKLNSAQSVQYTKKSVVMLEIPSGITAISNSYFAGTGNFPLCVSVQFPGTVTSYGSSLFQTNSVIKIVEFLDGTEPITMGDQMFGSNWSVGTSAIEYVKFPNNLVSIGNNTFGKAKYVSKTVILGANLETIGTGFFGESTLSSTDTFIYVSDKFFADTTKVFANLFGNEAPHHGNNLRLTIFYVGSKENAQKLAEACAALETGYCFNEGRVQYVSASEYDYATHKPTDNKRATIIYDVDKCDAFYGGHIYEGTGLCVDGFDCVNCDKTIAGTTSHNEVKSFAFENGYTQGGLFTNVCTNEGCKLREEVALDPIFSALEANGFSTNGTGISFGGYTVNNKALQKFEETCGVNLTFGIAIMNPKYVGDTFFADGKINATNGAITADMSDTEYANIKVMIDGFTGSLVDLELVIALYAYTDVNDVEFIQSADTKSACSSVAKNDATLYTVSVNSIDAKACTSLDALLPYEPKELV